jgi:hypothetical protein
MKKKTAKQPKAVQLKDLKPKKNPKGGGDGSVRNLRGTFNFQNTASYPG